MPAMSSSKKLPVPTVQRGSYEIFKIMKSNQVLRKRAKFAPERREEVKAVRGRRACLRCALLKTKCSEHDICLTCKQLINHKHERKVLAFAGCIRTRLQEVSVFEYYIPSQYQKDNSMVIRGLLTSANISLESAPPISSEVVGQLRDVPTWLNDPFQHVRSTAAILSSREFLELIAPFVDRETLFSFRCMLHSLEFARNEPKSLEHDRLKTEKPSTIASTAGHYMLRILDDRLRPTALKSCSYEELRVLFLLVCGTLLTAANVNRASGMDTDSFATTKTHLCQILVHYWIFLATQLKLGISTRTERYLLEVAATLWTKHQLDEALLIQRRQLLWILSLCRSKGQVSRDESPLCIRQRLDSTSTTQRGSNNGLRDCRSDKDGDVKTNVGRDSK